MILEKTAYLFKHKNPERVDVDIHSVELVGEYMEVIQ